MKNSGAYIILLLTSAEALGLTTVKTTECYFVKQASVLPSREGAQPDNLATANVGHSLLAGNSLVLVVREYERTEKMVDSGVFTKLTIQLPCPDVKTCRDVAVSKVTYLTQGGTSWVSNGMFSTAEGFEVETTFLARQSCGVRVTGSALTVNRLNKSVQQHNLLVKCTPGIVDLADLSHWAGKAGNNTSAFIPEEASSGLRTSDKERSCMRE